MIGATLSTFILAAVMSTFLFLGRSGANIQNYNDMESQARKALELFAEDIRQASDATWNSNSDVTLTVNGQFIRYYLSATAPAGTTPIPGRYFYRLPPAATPPAIPGSPSATNLLVSGIVPPVARTSEADTTCTPFFRAYSITGVELTALEYAAPSAAELAAVKGSTKQIQISLEAIRSNRTVVAATNTVLSARFILRNKRVTA